MREGADRRGGGEYNMADAELRDTDGPAPAGPCMAIEWQY